MKPRLIVAGPLPPPRHGVTVSTSLVLASAPLRHAFSVEHLDTSDHRGGSNLGRWDLPNVAAALRSLAKLALALRGEPGVVYLPLSQSLPGFIRDALFIRLAAARGWAVAAHLRGSEFQAFFTGQRRPARRFIRSSLQRLDSMAVMGESLREVFHGLIEPHRIAVVANGTPDPRIEPGADDGRTGLFLSNIRARKGVVEALEAALLVTAQEPTARFLFVGDTSEPELLARLEQSARAASGRIQFRPGVAGDDHRAVLSEASFLLFPPTEPEGHPRVVLEAMAAGLPVISTDQGAIAETVADGESGFVLERADPEELAERMLRLLRTPGLRARMGAAARDRFLARFTQEEADRRLAQWLEGVWRAHPVSRQSGPDHGDNRPAEVLFLAPADVSKGRVEPISWVRTCAAFAARGLRVDLLTIRVRRPDSIDIRHLWSHFGVSPTFTVHELPSPLRHDSSSLASRATAAMAGCAVAIGVIARQALRRRRLIVYARSPALIGPLAWARNVLPVSRRPTIVFETHALPPAWARRVLIQADLIVVNSRRLAGDLAARFGIARERVLHVPLGPYNPARPEPKDRARAALGLPADVPLGCYTGKIVGDQTDFLLRATRAVRDQVPDFRLLLVGGNPQADLATRAQAQALGLDGSLIQTGFVAPAEVGRYQAAADVLVFHMDSGLEHFEYCTPAKGLEYQATGRPIVATDIPLFEEVFGEDGDRAVRVRERTPKALADAIVDMIRREDGGAAMTERAAAWVAPRTWQRRADAVLDALGS